MTQDTDAQEGYADGIAGREIKPAASLAYVGGYANGAAAATRAASLIKQIGDVLAGAVHQPHKLLEDE